MLKKQTENTVDKATIKRGKKIPNNLSKLFSFKCGKTLQNKLQNQRLTDHDHNCHLFLI